MAKFLGQLVCPIFQFVFYFCWASWKATLLEIRAAENITSNKKFLKK